MMMIRDKRERQTNGVNLANNRYHYCQTKTIRIESNNENGIAGKKNNDNRAIKTIQIEYNN